MWRRGDVLGDEGFTIAELLIVIAFAGLLGAAVVGVYDAGQRTYVLASSLEEAQLGARYGIDLLATELRLAGAYWRGATGAGAAIAAATPTSITFTGDLDADTVVDGIETTITASTPPGTTVVVSGTPVQAAAAFNAAEYLYVGNGVLHEVRPIASVSATTISLGVPLMNTYPAGSVVRSVETVTYSFDPGARALTRAVGGGPLTPIVSNVTALALTYFDGASPPMPTTTVSQIREIAISITAQGPDGSRRTMTTRVRPRNLGSP